MKKPTIKASDLIQAARELAALYPDAKYDNGDGCCYSAGEVRNGPPVQGCILGQAAREISHEFFAQRLATDDFDGEKIAAVPGIVGGINQKAWLTEVQSLQDEGSAWGDAVKTANKEFPVRIRKAKPQAQPQEAT